MPFAFEKEQSIDGRIAGAMHRMGLKIEEYKAFESFMSIGLMPHSMLTPARVAAWSDVVDTTLDLVSRSVVEAQALCRPWFDKGQDIPQFILCAIAMRDMPRDGYNAGEILKISDTHGETIIKARQIINDFKRLSGERVPTRDTFESLHPHVRFVVELHAIELCRRALLSRHKNNLSELFDHKAHAGLMMEVARFRPIMGTSDTAMGRHFENFAARLDTGKCDKPPIPDLSAQDYPKNVLPFRRP